MTDVADATTDTEPTERDLFFERLMGRVKDLGQLGAFLDQHPDFPAPMWNDTTERFLVFVSPYEPGGDAAAAAELARLARLMAPCEKSGDGAYFELTRWFGDVALMAYTPREAVCERRQVGTETVTRPLMEQVGTETVEEPVYEWDCKPILAAATNGDES